MPTQKIGFLKGLDKDSDIRLLNNAYRDALNVRITDYESGDKFTIVNAKGNTEIEYTLPDGHNVVIGSFDDKVNKNVYYFVYNSEDNHLILKYDYKEGDISLILRDTSARNQLNFSVDNYITSVALLDNRFLIYTDNLNEPRWIDLDNLSKYSDPLSSGDLLDIAKAPQDVPVICNYTTNSSKKYNNLIGKLWQFRTVYVYKDGTRSVFSTISKVPLPTIDSQSPFTEDQDISIDNEITLSVPTPPQDVSKVELYAQGVNGDTEKTTNWYLFNTVTRQDIIDSPTTTGNNTYGDFSFANDEIYTLADPLEVAQSETYVPKKAKALDIIHGNRLALANITDGFDIDDIDLQCSLTFTGQNVPAVNSATGVFSYNNFNTVDPTKDVQNSNGIKINNTSPAAVDTPISIDPTFDTITITTTPVAFDQVEFTIRLTYNIFDNGALDSTQTEDFLISYIVKESDIGTNTNANVAKGIADAINSTDTKYQGMGGVVAIVSGTQVRVYQGQNVIGIVGNKTAVTASALTGSITVTNLATIAPQPTFKRGAIHEFGIEYSDEKGRRSTVITNGQLKRLTPEINGLTSTGTRGRVTAQIQIFSDPPSWATSYSILYTKNQSFEKTLYFIGTLTDEGNDVWSLELKDLYYFRLYNQGTPIVYDYQEGDVVQIIESVGGTYVKSDVPPLSITQEEETSANPQDAKIYFNWLNTGSPLVDTARYLFEIRRPKKTTSEKFYYEIGHTYEISGGYHTGNTQDQTASLPAIIDLNDVGDAYYKRRNFVAYTRTSATQAASTEFVEDYNYSDYYDSDVTSIGRGSVKDDNFKERNRETTIVYSQPYIPETNVNGISTFYGTSLEQYSTQYGSIQHIYSEGRRLFVFQENKVGQIGINEQFFLNGTQQTYQTEKVLNPIQYYPAEYGIGQCPESFCVFGYRKYFVDTLRSSVIRLSQDGLTPISDNGIRGFINNDIGGKDNKRIRLVYNKNFEELTYSSVNSSWVEDVTTSNKTITSCTIIIPKSKFPDLDSVFSSAFCIYMNVQGESSTEYVERTATSTSISTYDINNWEIDLSFSAVTTSNYTIALLQQCDYNVLTFSEEAGSWISRWSYEPEWMEEAGIGLVTFKDGKCYLQDSNATRGRFYGTNYAAQVTVVANENPSYPKIFKTIQQESTTQWECPSILTLESQSSNLIDDDFEKIQNQWYASFWFDSNTPNVTDPLINGDPLRSTAMEIQMQNDSTSEEKMFAVGVNYIVSNLSNDE